MRTSIGNVCVENFEKACPNARLTYDERRELGRIFDEVAYNRVGSVIDKIKYEFGYKDTK